MLTRSSPTLFFHQIYLPFLFVLSYLLSTLHIFESIQFWNFPSTIIIHHDFQFPKISNSILTPIINISNIKLSKPKFHLNFQSIASSMPTLTNWFQFGLNFKIWNLQSFLQFNLTFSTIWIFTFILTKCNLQCKRDQYCTFKLAFTALLLT